MTAVDLQDKVDEVIMTLATTSVLLYDVDLNDEDLVLWRARAHAALKAVHELISTVDTLLLATVPVGTTVTVPGAGQVVVEVRGKSVTNGTHLARVLAARVADTPCNEDGEKLPPAELCARTAEEVVVCFGLDTPSTRFRRGELKSRGLKPGLFEEWTDSQPSVRFIDGAAR